MTERVELLRNWMARVSGSSWTWSAKYIAANDTYIKPNVNQAGPYVGKELLRLAFPTLERRSKLEKNPDLVLPIAIASHGVGALPIRLVWYNNAIVERKKGGRNEARLTGWGGREHPLVDEDATGSLALFAFHQSDREADAEACEIWISQSMAEEEEVLSAIGPLEPGRTALWRPTVGSVVSDRSKNPCRLGPGELRPEWALTMPSGEEIIGLVLGRLASVREDEIDKRLVRRRECEFEMFRSLEDHLIAPRVRQGFADVDEFVAFSHSVTNRRKARAGRSLELQMKAILIEEQVSHSWTERTEDKRTPDFIFPSIEHYHRASWPTDKLLMLAAKTTCKDRWRQILNEAERIPRKHLLTLQEGVSVSQFREMTDEGVTLVVPRSLHSAYPAPIRPQLMSLADFVVAAKSLVA